MLLEDDDAERLASSDGVWDLLDRYVSPEDVELERTAVYNFRSLVATPWRRGQVFLAGDAAHLQPPMHGAGTLLRRPRRSQSRLEARRGDPGPRPRGAARHLRAGAARPRGGVDQDRHRDLRDDEHARPRGRGAARRVHARPPDAGRGDADAAAGSRHARRRRSGATDGGPRGPGHAGRWDAPGRRDRLAVPRGGRAGHPGRAPGSRSGVPRGRRPSPRVQRAARRGQAAARTARLAPRAGRSARPLRAGCG